jgi:hypothetical protein
MHRILLLPALLALLISPLPAIEIGLEGRAGDIQFPWSNKAATPAGTGPFTVAFGDYFWGGSGWVDVPLGEDYSIHFAYETDPVLRNIATTVFRFERGVTRIGVGPFFGFLNQDGRLGSVGLSTSIQVQWPGLGFISARSDGGLALGLVAGIASVPQTRAELAAGFYTPNAIVSGVVSGKRFSETDSTKNLITDDLTRYALVVDIYKKNIPYQITTTIGYELRSKYFQSSNLTDTLGSAIIGLKLSVEALPGFRVFGELTNSIFTFGLDNLAARSPAASAFLFSANLGFSLNVDPIAIVERFTHAPSPPPAPSEATVAPATQAPVTKAPATQAPAAQGSATSP